MAVPLIGAALAWLHIFFTIGWMGGAMCLVLVMSPILPTFSTQTRGELILKLFPRMVKFTISFATLTIVFGVILAFSIVGGNLARFSPDSFWGMTISIGAATALTAYLVALALVRPTAKRIISMVQEAQQNPQQGPPPQLATLQRRLRIGSTAILALLIVSLVFMVAASRLPTI